MTDLIQPSLFDPDAAQIRLGRFRRHDPQTSIDAASDIVSRLKWGTARHLLLAQFREVPIAGLTYEEAGARVGLDNVKATRRCSELKRDGLIRETDKTRKTSSGHSASVYQITEQGRYRLADLNGRHVPNPIEKGAA